MSTPRPSFSLYRESLAIINGLLGDWLHHRGNPLALNMYLSGKPKTDAQCQRKICVLVHGLTETSSIWDYPKRRDTDYGALLARFEAFSPLYLHYNTGLGLRENGELLAAELERLVQDWPTPIDQLCLIGHSMGGLIIRAACEAGRSEQKPWLASVSECVYLGTPHLGAPLARLAHQGAQWLRRQELVPLQVAGELLDVRSTGICNLTSGCWDTLSPPTLVNGIRHFVASGSLHVASNARTDEIPGDALVPRSSARGPHSEVWGLAGEAHFAGVGHLRLAHHSDVYLQIAQWCRHE